MERGKQQESLAARLWEKVFSLVRGTIDDRSADTRSRVANTLQPVLQEASEPHPTLERPTMISLVTSAEKKKLDEALDIQVAIEKLQAGEEILHRDFTLGNIPFRVSFSFSPHNINLVHVQITSPADADVLIECNYIIDDTIMDLQGVYMGGLKKNKLGTTIMRSLLRSTNRVEIRSIVNRETQDIGWDLSSGDLPDYIMKNNSPLAGMLGKEFICKFDNHGNEIIGIRVDEKLQALLRAAKNYDGDKNELRNIYGAYVSYMKSPAYLELDDEAQSMCTTQRDALAELLSK